MSHPFRTLVPLTIAAAAFVLPATAAQADTFCVGAPAGCHGAPSATLQGALDAAAALPGADRVELAAGATAHGFTIAAGNAVELVGAGGVPAISADDAHPVSIDEPQATVRGVRVQAGGSGVPAPVDLRRGTIDGSEIVNGTGGTAVRVVDGTLRGTRVTEGTDAGAVGVLADGGAATLEDTSVEGTTGVVVDGATLVLDRVRVSAGAIFHATPGGGSALRVTAGSTVTADDSAFALAGAPGDATIDVRGTTGTTTVTLRSVTVHPLPHDDLPATAQGVRAQCTGGAATVELLDTVVTGYSPDIMSAGAGCSVDRQHAAYATADAVGGATIDAGSFFFDTPLPGRTWVEATPTFGSVLIDHSSGRPVRSGETDLNGLPRVVDGRRDIGAYEYQHRAPRFALDGDGQAVVGSLQTFVARGADPDGDPVTIAWTVDGARVGAGVPGLPGVLRSRFTSPGRHVVGLDVTDSSGLGSRSEETVNVVGQPVGDPPVWPPVVSAPARRAPIATLLSHRLGARPLQVRIACRGAVTCAGTVRLTAKVGRSTLSVGRVRFRVGAGRTATVRVPVTVAARRSLRRHHRLTVRVALLHSSGTHWANGQYGRIRP
ncbi:MAG TPA: hypothetical protein VGM33_15525 [Baekduia sp.]|jgi:hypothetical protein